MFGCLASTFLFEMVCFFWQRSEESSFNVQIRTENCVVETVDVDVRLLHLYVWRMFGRVRHVRTY